MKAAIDIGSNTVLLLVGEVVSTGIYVVREEQRIPRLGKGVDQHKNLDEGSISRVLDVLKEYKTILEQDHPEVTEVIVTATSAVRDAENREAFLKEVSEETGFKVRVLTGDEEAQMTFFGALSAVDDSDARNFFVLDIGGGSTELAMGSKDRLMDFHSFDMGCVRFKERFLVHNPPFQEEIIECREEIQRLFSKKKFRAPREIEAIGVAGTATSLAAIDLQLDEFENDAISGHIIRRDKLSKGIEVFSLHTYDQLLELSPKLLKGRQDIFLAGLLILEGFMKYHDIDEIKVSTGGIRHGALLSSKKD